MPEVRQKKKANRRPLTGDKKDKEKELSEKVEERAKEESKAKAQEYKTQGNDAFQAKEYLRALDLFTKAIAEDMTDHVFYSNRSAVNLALMRTSDAVADAQGCVDIKPDWAKGYSRLGAALWADKQFERAVTAYEKGLTLDADNAALKEGLAGAQKDKKKQDDEQAAAAAAEAEAAAAAEPSGPVEPVIGIDLGTTYSAVAVWDEAQGGVRMLADEAGNRTTASVVGWSPDGERIVGDRAKAQAARCPERTLFDVKRIIGRRMHEDAVKAEKKLLPYKIVAGAGEKPMIEVELSEGKKVFAPEEVSAMVLRRMKEIAEKELGREIKKAVVTVPAYFNDAQRVATQQAGAIAGLDVLRIINEPTAAALGYGLDQKAGKSGSNVLIFDLGGGTFDVSVLRIEGGVLEVKSTGGDTRCGGEDLDNTLVEHMLNEVKKKGIKDPSHLRSKFKRTAEAVKRDLSSKDRVELDLDELGTGVDGTICITRELFESLNKGFFDRVFKTVEQVVKDAKLTNREVDDIVLVGGSTRVPLIQQRLLQWGGKALCKSINPDEAVAYGAAVQGAILSGVRSSSCQDMVLIDVTPLSLGIETEGRHHSIIIPRNSAIPCTKRSTYTTTENYQDMIDCRVFEGERPCTDQNHLLGEFQITGIEVAKQGEAQIEVTFALDANGVLHVTAQDLKTKARAECTINNACKSLSKEEIARMLQEAGKMEESDANFRKKVAVRDELESLAYDVADDAKRDELLEWLDRLDLSAISLSSLESKLSAAQRRAEA